MNNHCITTLYKPKIALKLYCNCTSITTIKQISAYAKDIEIFGPPEIFVPLSRFYFKDFLHCFKKGGQKNSPEKIDHRSLANYV